MGGAVVGQATPGERGEAGGGTGPRIAPPLLAGPLVGLTPILTPSRGEGGRERAAGGVAWRHRAREHTHRCVASARARQPAGPSKKDKPAPLHLLPPQLTDTTVVGRFSLARRAVVCSLRRRTPKKDSSSAAPAADIGGGIEGALFFLFLLFLVGPRFTPRVLGQACVKGGIVRATVRGYALLTPGGGAGRERGAQGGGRGDRTGGGRSACGAIDAEGRGDSRGAAVTGRVYPGLTPKTETTKPNPGRDHVPASGRNREQGARGVGRGKEGEGNRAKSQECGRAGGRAVLSPPISSFPLCHARTPRARPGSSSSPVADPAIGPPP